MRPIIAGAIAVGAGVATHWFLDEFLSITAPERYFWAAVLGAAFASFLVLTKVRAGNETDAPTRSPPDP